MNRLPLSKPLMASAAALALTCLAEPSAQGGIVGAQWSSGTNGTLNGTSVTLLANGGNPLVNDTVDLSGQDFRFAPLSASGSAVMFSHNSNLTATFAVDVARLRLYVASWRPGTYSFDRTFTIRSGSGITQAGSQITVASGFASGIIEFTEDVSFLNITSSAFGGGSFSQQGLQFGIGTGSLSVAVRGPRTIQARRSFVRVRGTADGPAALARIEYRASGESLNRAIGTSDWKFRFRAKSPKSRIMIRAVDVIGRKSPVVRVTINRPG